jgi:hypothetical protein
MYKERERRKWMMIKRVNVGERETKERRRGRVWKDVNVINSLFLLIGSGFEMPRGVITLRPRVRIFVSCKTNRDLPEQYVL